MSVAVAPRLTKVQVVSYNVLSSHLADGFNVRNTEDLGAAVRLQRLLLNNTGCGFVISKKHVGCDTILTQTVCLEFTEMNLTWLRVLSRIQ